MSGLPGAAAFGTEVVFDMSSIHVWGRTIRGIVEGDSDRAARDAEAGEVIKPVLRTGSS